jgi:hypothetical protein
MARSIEVSRSRKTSNLLYVAALSETRSRFKNVLVRMIFFIGNLISLFLKRMYHHEPGSGNGKFDSVFHLQQASLRKLLFITGDSTISIHPRWIFEETV